MNIEVKTDDQLLLMRKAGLAVAAGLDAMQEAATVGVSTAELDDIGRDVLAAHGASSNFLGYGAEYGTPFSGVACISINEELVHGVPGPRRLVNGDVVSIDFGAVVEGWHGDAARTFVVGDGTTQDHDLVNATREALWAGIAAARVGGKVSDISRAIEDRVKAEPRSYGVLRDYTGHGIGSAMHMEPDVPNTLRRRPSPRIKSGMVLAIEPMLTRGLRQSVVLDDEWTVVSRDKSRGAHWEHSVAILDDGVWILTEPDGGRAECRRRAIALASLAEHA